MVKNKVSELEIKDLALCLFNFSIFAKKKVSKKTLGLHSLILLIILGILATGINDKIVSGVSDFNIFVQILTWFPIILLVFFGLFFVFLNAFDDQKKGFWDGFLVLSTVTMPFFIIGNSINFLSLKLVGDTFLPIVLLFSIALAIYCIIVFIFTFKSLYNVSIYKVITAAFLIFFIFTITSYLQILIMSLQV